LLGDWLKKLLLASGIVLVLFAPACVDPSDGGSNPSNGIIESVDDLSQLQPGHWYRIADSALKNVSMHGSSPCNTPYYPRLQRITDYSGAAVSQQGRIVLVHGGGYKATAFNGILGFDLDTLSWRCIDEGSEVGLQDDWAPGKSVFLDGRIVVDINNVLHLFKVTWINSSNQRGTTGKTEPDWAEASRKGDKVNGDNDQITWTNQGAIGWQANHEYPHGSLVIGDVGVNTATKFLWGDGQTSFDVFKCSSPEGTSASEEPDWSSAVNHADTVVDGKLVWTNMGMIQYQHDANKQEYGGYPWDARVGAVQSFSHLVFSENKNTLIKPVSYSPYPSPTYFINDHPWLFDMTSEEWTEWPIDSDLNKFGAANISSMAIDQKRDIVWMYRKGGKSGPRLWSLDLNERTWKARDDGKTYYSNGAVAFINPDLDELILYGRYDREDVYAVFSIDPQDFDQRGFVEQRYLYKEGSIGKSPSGDFDFVTKHDSQSHYAAYDKNYGVLVAYAVLQEATEEQKRSIYLRLPRKHLEIRVPAHPDSHMTPNIDVSRPYGRWNYIEAYNVFVYIDSISNDVFLYKLSEDIKDISPPSIIDFVIPTTSSSRTVPIESLRVEDTHLWSVKFAVSELATAPDVASDTWLNSPPKEYYIKNNHADVTLYAYAMDMFGNVSPAVIASTTVNSDIIPPVVDTFIVPTSANSLQVDIQNFEATDNVAVAGYLITELPQKPAIDDPGWRSSPPKQWMLKGGWQFMLYAWVKDIEGNISSPASALLDVVLSEHRAGAIKVGPHRRHTTLAAAIKEANNRNIPGQRIEVDAGSAYGEEEEIYITVDNLTILGVSGGLGLRAHLYPSDGKIKNNAFISNRYDGKGAGLTLQWLEISDLNEPAVKYHNNTVSAHLVIEDCKIYRSSNTGVLVGACPNLSVEIRRSELHSNGNGSGRYHNIYIGSVKEFILEYSYSHDSHGGQLVKSRAAKNYIQYNRLTDEGLLFNSNHLIDLPYGGESYVIGNHLHMSAGNTSGSMIQWAREIWPFVQVKDATEKLTALPDYETYRIVRDDIPTGQVYRAAYYYMGGLEGRSNHKTAATMPDLRVGDVLTWNNGTDSTQVTSVEFPWPAGQYARHLYVVGNTIVNDRTRSAYLVRAHKDSEEIVFVNNLIIDRSGNLSWDHESVDERRITRKNNNLWFKRDPGLVDIERFDYSLKSTADEVIDKGAEWGSSASGILLSPQRMYRHPLSYVKRFADEAPDVGAYEFLK